MPAESKAFFAKLLLKWWEKNGRKFPWRNTKDPYAVLIAEILLRKTTAKQVERVYNSFISRYYSPDLLAGAEEAELKKMLKPLGLGGRSKLLIEFGKVLVEKFSGTVPDKAEDLMKLPGVGLYSANAVLSFIYGQKVSTLDSNFIRVIKRVFGFTSSKARARNDKRAWEFANNLVPKGRSREFNWAVLDFASLVCKSRSPLCSQCILKNYCVFFADSRKIEK